MLELHAFSKSAIYVAYGNMHCCPSNWYSYEFNMLFTKRQFVFGSKHVYDRTHIDESSTMINIGAYVLAIFG